MLLRMRPARRLDDDGSVLVSVLIIMLVLTIGALVLSSIVVNTTGMLAGSRGTAQSRAAADAGLSDTIARAQRGEDVCTAASYASTAPKYSVSVLCDSGTVTFRATGTGLSGGRTVTEAVYARNVVERKLAGALVMAEGGFSSTNLSLTAPAIDGDVVINKGDFDCNNKTVIEGDVVVRDGDAALSNECHIYGDLVVKGKVLINNNAVGVDGDVYTGGTYTHTTGATVKGNVYAVGDVSINSGGSIAKSVTTLGSFTIDGSGTSSATGEKRAHVDGTTWAAGAIRINNTPSLGPVVSPSTATVHIFGSTITSARLAGALDTIQSSTVTGDLLLTSPTPSKFRAGVVVGGNLTSNAPKNTDSKEVAPSVSGATTYSASQSAPPSPVVQPPWQMTSTAFEWIDLGFAPAAWGGFATRSTPSCDFQNNASNVSAVNGFTSPTIVDLRACAGTTTMYNAKFSIKTDVAFILPPGMNAQNVGVVSSDGAAHQFHMIVPDGTADKTPTCTARSATLNIYGLVMSTKISGLAYSPCTIQTGGSGHWNGQVYAGAIERGATNDFYLEYREVTVPGMQVGGGGGGGGAASPSLVKDLISLGDV